MSLKKVFFIVAMTLSAAVGVAQEVRVSQNPGVVTLSVQAQKPYQLVTGAQKRPTLTVECALKGKQQSHIVKFSPGGMLTEEDATAGSKNGAFALTMTIGGSRRSITWVAYGEVAVYAYFGRTELERTEFLQALLSSPTASIEFTPFLTGTPAISAFDLSELRNEVAKYPECSIK